MKESDDFILKKKELIFLVVLALSAAALWAGSRFFSKDSNDMIQITVGGELFGTYSLDEEQTIEINDTNICEIKNGEAKMIHATCPDHLCMEQNPVDSHGGTIVCLPNKVVIEGGESASSDDNFPELDAVS